MKKNNQPICETDECGNKCWILNNHLHREDAPAMEFSNGDKSWWCHGQRHRLDGPAIEYANGIKFWYYHGKLINALSQKEFERLIKLQALW